MPFYKQKITDKARKQRCFHCIVIRGKIGEYESKINLCCFSPTAFAVLKPIMACLEVLMTNMQSPHTIFSIISKTPAISMLERMSSNIDLE